MKLTEGQAVIVKTDTLNVLRGTFVGYGDDGRSAYVRTGDDCRVFAVARVEADPKKSE